MFKFLRKYNKWILAVGGTLLLITFLIPFAFTELGRMRSSGERAWAQVVRDQSTIDLTTASRHQAAQDFDILRGWLSYIEQSVMQRRSVPAAAVETSTQVRQLLSRLETGKISDEHWFLLTHEAEQAGLIGGPSDAYGLMIAEDGDDVIDALGRQSRSAAGLSTRLSVQQALARIRGVGRLLTMYRDAARFSDRRLLAEARRLFHNVVVDFVPIQAVPAGSSLQPTEEQLQAQLDAYGDIEPGHGEHGFGYRLPNRVRLEWITVYATSVRHALESSDRLSQVELRKHWKRNEQDSSFGPADPSKPVPAAVRQDLLDTLTRQRLDEIARAAQLELEQSRRGVPRRGGYLLPPADWREIPLGNVANAIGEQFAIELPIYRSGPKPWLAGSDLRGLPEIGVATTTMFGQTPLGLATLAMNCREFDGNPIYLVQQGVAGPMLRHEDGSIFIWRLNAVDAARAPRSVDEVRDDLVADLRKLDHYQTLAASIDRIREQAVTQGMLATALAHDTSVRRVSAQLCDFNEIQKQASRGQPLRAAPTELPVIGNDAQVVAALVELGQSLPMSAIVSDLPADQRTVAHRVPDRLCVAVAQLVDQRPLTLDLFTGYMQFRDFSALLGSGERSMEEALYDAFSYDALAQRHHFVLVDRQEAEDSGS